MYVADYTGHNILKVDMKSKKISVFAHEPKMNQPNDIVFAPMEISMRVTRIGRIKKANFG